MGERQPAYCVASGGSRVDEIGGRDRDRTGLQRRERKSICFFFQAEDGIRDTSVTGVQTCALPISRALARVDEAEQREVAQEHTPVRSEAGEQPAPVEPPLAGDRKSVVEGKRVEHGGRRMKERKINGGTAAGLLRRERWVTG